MSDYSPQVNAILSRGPIIGANAATILDPTWNATYRPEQAFAANAYINNPKLSVCGVYGGSISSLGNMVAMTLGDNYLLNGNISLDARYKDSSGNFINNPSNTAYNANTGGNYVVLPEGAQQVPWLTGYFRTYWLDPQKTTFGSNSAIPALTGVMPAKYQNQCPGSFLYYVDLQMTRLSGSPYWDNQYFINIFNQLIGYVITSNDYTKGLLESESKNLKYFGFNSYDDLVTQGWNAYKASLAIPKSFKNLGLLVETLSLGYFGTSNAVAKSMIDHGLGPIGQLSTKLFNAGIIYQQINNPAYTPQIDAILQTITSPADLETIQSVLKTTVQTDLLTSPLSYTSIESTSGVVNDSGFKNLAAVGKDIYLKAPGVTFTTGAQVAAFITNIQTETSDSIENLKTNDSLLTPQIVQQLRNYLPLAANNAPISMLNVIGTASGYWTENIELVNEGIAELYATNYGTQIINILSEISRYFAKVPVSLSETIDAEKYTPVPPPQSGIDSEGNPYNIPGTGGPDWWAVQCLKKQSEYFALLNTIAADPAMTTIVNKINSNYDEACGFVAIEVTNYNKANISVSTFNDNSQIFAFVSSIPAYAVDQNQIGTDYMLYQLTQPNDAGNVAQTLANQAKNENAISNAGGKTTGLV